MSETMNLPTTLDITSLQAAYRRGELTPTALVEALSARLDAYPDSAVWITRLSREQLLAYARDLEGRDPATLPLYGIPFAIKDNIDLAGVPTTAACPDFTYTPERSATVVEALIAAGAIPLGKSNLDQFATGLVGTRSPYGACRNTFNPDYISGGSSSGSSVAVAAGLASFSLGTDTAGSGRVPAAFNNLIGLKPSHGLLSTRGVLPACRSLDCVSIFALSSADAAQVLEVAAGYDAEDIYSRRAPRPAGGFSPERFRFGVPAADQLEFFGNGEAQRLFNEAVARLEAIGGEAVTIDFAPFAEAARLLYEGPWVAERYVAIRDFIEQKPEALLEVTRTIIGGGAEPRAAEAFAAAYRLQALRRASEAAWHQVDFIVTPTAGTIYTIEALQADPITLNSNLGYYTNFMNLLDLSAVAVPAGFQADGLPFGVTLFAPAFQDQALLAVGDRLHRAQGLPAGATGAPLPPTLAPIPPSAEYLPIAVCGAHMSGLPLNHQLVARGGRLRQRARTAPHYRLYALAGGPPQRPGLVRDEAAGAAIELELWELPAERYGDFVAAIPAPLGIGQVELASGETVPGFLCEGYAVAAAEEITALGGWRAWLESAA